MAKLCRVNQDTPISQRSKVMQNWLQANSFNCPEFIEAFQI